MVLIDLITTYKDGRRVDSTLSDLRREYKKSPRKYRKILKEISNNMKEEGYYEFGGRGDNDVIIYMKKHPHLRDSAKLQSLKGSLEAYFRENPKAKTQFNEAIERRQKWVSEKEAKENYYSNIMYDIMVNGYKPTTQRQWNRVLNRLLNGKGYIKNATAWNKRQQIWFTPAWKADGEFVANYYDNYLRNLKKAERENFENTANTEYLEGISNGYARYIIARDLDPTLKEINNT